MIQSADSGLRNAPLGDKGKGTVDLIIDTTADLLEAQGYEALTTNHIAEAAGVNIATVYKYFANKHAILIALHERMSLRWIEALRHAVDEIGQGMSWRETVCQTIDVAVARRRIASGAAAMRIAMRVSPQLQFYDRAESIESAGLLADMLIARASVDAVTAARVARVSIEVGMAVLDLMLQENAVDDPAWVDEAKAVVCNYLAPYFEDPAHL